VFYGEIEYSFWAKIARLFFQPPYLYCRITYENGTEKSFRVIKPILKGGILVNKKVNSHTELGNYYASQGDLNENVSSLEFYSKFNSGFVSDK
jgi:hypothetical protein